MSNGQPFVNVTVSAPCDTHELRPCLEVDPGNNGREASFDNVTSFCDTNVGVERSTWGAVKTLFQRRYIRASGLMKAPHVPRLR